MTPCLRLAFAFAVATLFYPGLAILGSGGFAAFFSHPALIALAIITCFLSAAWLLSSGNASPGEREDRANRWVLVVFALSGLLAIQRGHTLVTDGIFSVVRNPSYLGMLILTFGWALAFRSWVGVLLAVLLIPSLVARIRAEEGLLRTQFGDEYEAYLSRTSRLIPGLY